MSRVPWDLFQDRQPRAIGVGAIVQVAGPADGDELAAMKYVLKRRVSKQKPAGAYASMVARDAGRPEVYFAFRMKPMHATSPLPWRLNPPAVIQAGRASAHSRWTVRSSWS
jgi:hypothetical protein